MTKLSIAGGYVPTTTADEMFFNDLFPTGWDWGSGSSWTYWANSSNYKIFEKEDHVLYDFLAAGLTKEDISVDIDNHNLIVSSSKPGWNGNISEIIWLGSHEFDLDTAKASLANGVLRVKIDKANVSKKRSLKVE